MFTKFRAKAIRYVNSFGCFAHLKCLGENIADKREVPDCLIM